MEFRSLDDKHLLLEVTSHNSGSIEILLKNEDYNKAIVGNAKFAMLILLFGVFGYLLYVYFVILVILGIVESFLIYRILTLFKERKFNNIFCSFHYIITQTTISRKNHLHFVPWLPSILYKNYWNHNEMHSNEGIPRYSYQWSYFQCKLFFKSNKPMIIKTFY